MSRATIARRANLPPGRDATSRGMTTAPLTLPMDQARRLDLEADAELQHGHIARAEHLARQAAALRGWGA